MSFKIYSDPNKSWNFEKKKKEEGLYYIYFYNW